MKETGTVLAQPFGVLRPSMPPPFFPQALLARASGMLGRGFKAVAWEPVANLGIAWWQLFGEAGLGNWGRELPTLSGRIPKRQLNFLKNRLVFSSDPAAALQGARGARMRQVGVAKLKLDRGNRSLANASGSERSWPDASLTSRHSYGASHSYKARPAPKAAKQIDARRVQSGRCQLNFYGSAPQAPWSAPRIGALCTVEGDRYSAFNTVTGSTPVARRAGARQATTDTSNKTPQP